MYKKQVVVKSKTGLHARPGSEIVKIAMTFSSNIKIEFNGKEINAKEVLDVLMSDIKMGDEITIKAEGPDEEAAVLKITNYIETEEG